MNRDTHNTGGPDQHALVSEAWRQVQHAPHALAGAGGGRELGPDGLRLSAPEIPGYTEWSPLHRGGQGAVYRAVQASTRRTVAIKVMLHGAFAGEGERLRFAQEVKILGELRHPLIVTIHDSGVYGDLPYFIMDYVEGWPLDQFVARERPAQSELLRLFAQICEAVNAAHLRGVIHRDLKPGNIRIDRERRPRVLDFGLAKLVREADEASSAQARTLTGQFVGSLPWASPEQARGQHDRVDLRTDVYSLGVVLYQLLTGAFPYDISGSLDMTLRNIASADPLPLRRIDRSISDDLQAITLKALSKEPERRYETAGALGRDVERYLAGHPVSAKRDSFAYVLRKQLARHRVVASVSGVLGLAVLLSTVAAWLMFARATHAAAQSRRSEREAQFSLADAYLAHAREMRLRREPGFRAASLALLAAAADIQGSRLDLRNEAVATLAHADLVVESVSRVPVLKGGRSVDLRAGCLVTGLESGEFLVRPAIDEAGEYRIPLPEMGDERGRVKLSPDGRVAVGTFHKRFSEGVRLCAWDTATGRMRWMIPINEERYSDPQWGFDPGGGTLVAAHHDKTIRFHDLADGRVVREFPIKHDVYDVCVLEVPGGSPVLLLADRNNPRLMITDQASGAAGEFPLPGIGSLMEQSPNKRWLAISSPDSRIFVYRVNPAAASPPAAPSVEPVLRLHAILSGHLALPRKLCFLLEGDVLATCGDDNATCFWDVAAGIQRFAPAHNTTLLGAEGDRALIATGGDTELQFSRIEFSPICRTLRAVPGEPTFFGDRYLALGGERGIEIWDTDTPERVAQITRQRAAGMHVSADEIVFAAHPGLQAVAFFVAPDHVVVDEPRSLWEDGMTGLCLAPDQRTAYVTRLSEVWSVPLHDPARSILTDHFEARRPKPSPDGKRLVVGHWRGNEVAVYSVADGARLFAFPTPDIGFAFGEFTPTRPDGGSLLIIATQTGYHFLDGDTYEQKHYLPRRGYLASLGVSPDGTMAVITRTGSEPVLLDLTNFQVLAELTLPEPNATLHHHAFDSDGTRLAIASNSGTVYLWDLAALRTELAALGLDWR